MKVAVEKMLKQPESWAADTSWLYALLDKDDEFHEPARKEAEEPGTIRVNPVILVELLELVRTKVDRTASLQALRQVLTIPQVQMADTPRHASMARVMERHGRISWNDASAICTALDEGCGLRSFDEAQRKAFQALA